MASSTPTQDTETPQTATQKPQKKKAAPTPGAGPQDTSTKTFRIIPLFFKQALKSWLLWRTVLTVFLAVLSIQAIILSFNYKYVEAEKLLETQHMAQAALAPLLEEAQKAHQGQAPVIGSEQALENPPEPAADQSLLNPAAIETLLATTQLTGLSLYDSRPDPLKPHDHPLTLLKSYGQAPDLDGLSTQDLAQDPAHIIGQTYQFLLQRDKNYTLAVSADISGVKAYMRNYAINVALIGLIIAVFVTAILILTLSHWLLDPIVFLRNNLLEASKHPERPSIPNSPFNPEGEMGNAIAIAQNLIRQNAFNLQQIKSSAEDRIYKLAYFDSLTTLPNRSFFLQKVERAIKPSSDRPGQSFFIIAIDLDHFKDINDSMGHNVGDAILRGVGKRLKAALPQSAMVSRTGEDEFAIMLEIKTADEDSEEIAQKVLDIIRGEPFKVFNESLQVRASAGIVRFPRDGQEAELLVKNADIALNRAKEAGRNTCKEYSTDFERAIQTRFQILRDLRDAMEKDQLVLFYQPQLDLKSGRIIGAEALIRWWKPDDSKEGGTFISPGEFIPVAEQSGLILPMGEWIMRQACKDAKEWNEYYNLDMRVAINVSAAQFAQSDITAFTKQTLEDLNLPPEKIELEVTESVFMDDISHMIQTLKNLHNLGVELAIDDFGTGYSSLSYLSQFPIDRLKIDQSFIRNALNDPNDASIAKTIIALGHSLNLKVIAEGVETREHENFLLNQGCDEVQGFRYSKPLPNDRFIEFCKEYNGDLRSFSQI